jgi:hypothetical protein
MALNTNFNVDPYYDDFNEDKNFHRILYKPGYAVQSRELTQSQTLLQDQIKKFGDHVFKSGSIVTGGQIFVQNTAYINLSSTYSGNDITAANFDSEYITSTDGKKKAYVLKAYDAVGIEPITLIINQMYGSSFTAGETIVTANSDPNAVNYYASANTTNPTGNSKAFSINSGVFYYEGFFVKNQPQSVAISKYDRANSTALVGFQITEDIVDYTQDTSLLDPAQSASNFQAPGADRYKITLTLTTRAVDSTDLSQFIQLSEFQDGIQKSVIQTPIYGPLGDELARRTYDESGDYIVKSFDITMTDNASNTAFANVTLSPGKAYVKGYEFGTVAPTNIIIPKPRTVTNVNNQRISADYGYYVYANSFFGNFATNQIANVDIYCVDTGQLTNYDGNSFFLANLKIGTAKVKAIAYDSSANTLDSNTYIYKLFVTDVNTRSIINLTDPSGSANGYYINTAGNTTTFTLPTFFSGNNDCYVGARIRMVGGNGSYDTARTIKYYDGSTRQVTVDRAFSQPIGTNSAAYILATGPFFTTNSKFVIDFDIGQAESFVVYDGTTRKASANVHPYSKRQVTTSGGVLHYPAYISESQNEPLLFKIGENDVAPNTLSDFSYSYSRLYQSVSFDGSGVSTALPIGVGESLQSATTTTALQQYYTIVSTSKGTSIYDVGTVVPATGIISVSTSTRKIDLGVPGASMTANVYATINSSNPTSKTKTFIRANTVLVDPAGGGTNNIFGAGNTSVYVSALDGQTAITSNTILVRTPGVPQSLFVSDVHSINAIFDFQGQTIDTTNYNNIKDNPSYNITSRYVLTTGQKDSYYDHSSIRLKPGQTPPTGPLLIRYNRFKSSGTGYFDVDSYTRLGPNNLTYSDIPTFITEGGEAYQLSDYLDFRTVRKDATDAYSANNYVFDVEESGATVGGIGPKIPQLGSAILVDYSYYLPRVDRVVLNRIGTFEVIQGVPSRTPVAPVAPDESMSLYILSYPAYLGFASSTNIQTFKNKRYTMKDIGALEKRIENLEYYTSLSLLEQSTVSKQDLSTLDSTGLPRYKNGIMVDSFIDKTVSNFVARDFSASIDIVNNLARNTYNLTSVKVFSNNSILDTGVEYNGPLLTLSGTTETFLTQNLASKSVNINPFNVINYVGSVKLDPPSDVWTSDTRVEAQNIDLTGGDSARDAWSSIQSTSWGAWQTTWTGVDQTAIGSAKTTTESTRLSKRQLQVSSTTTQDFLVTTTTNETRSGILSQIVPQQLTKSLGDRVVDVTIVQFMRNINILAVGTGFKPSTTLYTFFDNTNVDNYVYRANIVKFANNQLSYRTTINDPENVAFYDVATNLLMGSGVVVLTANNHAFITNIVPRPAYGSWSGATGGVRVVGETTGVNNILTTIDHYSGTANVGATVSTIILDYSAGGSSNTSEYVGQTIRIIGGTGAGQSRVINAYSSSTRTANISSNWTTTPDTTSTYSIGTLTSSIEGAVAGVFAAPTDTFRTGEKLFRLIDSSTGTVESSTTNGDASFFSQGLIQTKQETSVSVFVPSVVRSDVTESRSTSTSGIQNITTASSTKIKHVDPLAETFLINSDQYPQGIMLSSVRVCFKTKDVSAPVQLQIRPVVNGYPSSSTIYPYADVVLTPDKVNTSTIPNIDDPLKYTEFTFQVPVFLLPGEHSIVLLSNSIGYETFVAEKDQVNLASSAKISKQAYTGSFFESQNGSTWTAEQNIDMMFSLQKKVYTRNYGYAYFEVDMSSKTSNAVFDLMQVMSTDVVLSNTSIEYNFISQQDGSGTTHGFLPFVPNNDYKMVDGYGRRVLTTTAGNNTFVVRTTMQSSNPDISPMVDITRLNLLAIENQINNLGLSNSNIVIANVGGGMADGFYTLSLNLSPTGAGTGATATANVVGGKLSRVWITNPGSVYTTSPTINLFASTTVTTGYTGPMTYGAISSATGGQGASIIIIGEDKKEGGPAKVRYLTRKVQLASGFTAGDLRVYLLAYKPPLSNIYVYGKFLSPGDSEPFEDKYWNLLTQINSTNFVSSDENDFRELTFAPGNAGVVTNQILYTNSTGTQSFTDFATFAVKVVMTGESTVDVPKIKDLRIIALPDGL